MLFFLVIAALAPLGAQVSNAEKPVLVVGDFKALGGVSENETTSLRSLVLSYVDSYRFFRIVDSDARDLVLREQSFSQSPASTPEDSSPPGGLLHGDFLMTGSIGRVQDRYILTVEITRVSSADSHRFSESYDSLNRVMLQCRDFVRSFMESIAPSAQPQSVLPDKVQPDSRSSGSAFRSQVNVEDVAGIWQGDRGLSTVRLYLDGRGTAGLPGAVMKLRVESSGDTVSIIQDQPNIPEFYMSSLIGYGLAKTIAKDARPMRWIFRLTEDGSTLAGRKETTAVEVRDNKIEKLDNGYSRDSTWTRLR
jgi:hypothetical protein